MKGRVIWWNKDQGYGFVEYLNAKTYFVHLKKDDKKTYHLKENQVIEFELDQTEKGLFLKSLKTF